MSISRRHRRLTLQHVLPRARRPVCGSRHGSADVYAAATSVLRLVPPVFSASLRPQARSSVKFAGPSIQSTAPHLRAHWRFGAISLNRFRLDSFSSRLAEFGIALINNSDACYPPSRSPSRSDPPVLLSDRSGYPQQQFNAYAPPQLVTPYGGQPGSTGVLAIAISSQPLHPAPLPGCSARTAT